MAQAEQRQCTASGQAATAPRASALPRLAGTQNNAPAPQKLPKYLEPLLRRRRYRSTRAARRRLDDSVCGAKKSVQ